MPGLLVTFEGGEGSGKTTVMRRLAERLRALGHDPLLTREPGGTPLAEGVRALLLAPTLVPGAIAEALLMEAARADLVATLLRPALAAGRVVLCDRYADSTLAYQGGGRGLDLAMLAEWNRVATGGLVPDLTLLFDLAPEVGLARRASAAGETNRLDREDLAFHTRVRAAYRVLARSESARWVTLDASQSPEALEARAWEEIAARLPDPGPRP
jgi:dTMP kinase